MLAEAKLKWSTPDGDHLIAEMARVSSPQNQDNVETEARLINYLMRHRHWSPFEMVSMCIEIETTRDIGRQILRHRSFSFQEFSGRYAEYDDLNTNRDMRMQDHKNRQNSIAADDESLLLSWKDEVGEVAEHARARYKWALGRGVAKECARALLPEGLVPTRMYMTGTVRSWIHYISERTAPGVQLEHRELARRIEVIFAETFPNTYAATQLPTAEQARISELTSMLVRCQSQFAFYEQQHLAKCTQDGNDKAAVNASFVAEIGELLGK
mgnify:CR=1 FL=1